jgi:hypothetical protein
MDISREDFGAPREVHLFTARTIDGSAEQPDSAVDAVEPKAPLRWNDRISIENCGIVV